MPSPRSHGRHETGRMPSGAFGSPMPIAPSDAAHLCERAVQAIWHSLDAHDLLDAHVRADLADVLEPLAALEFTDRLPRLIKTLRMPDPIDPSYLYWLTRRLLTLVPELQAEEVALTRPAAKPPSSLT
ncbi:hypothetical protein QTI66_03900 [Variovorax sp. J22R133]|uniref:hypothetical protein n=1 Tax=Variovorax brevis TaxID=3053503 RepID=UPI002576BACF|nr:hypothetical protein [Variovorax sp. J22R133]MDM0111276.1 hypothetical protein [Variovorax sp. J22R133]